MFSHLFTSRSLKSLRKLCPAITTVSIICGWHSMLNIRKWMHGHALSGAYTSRSFLHLRASCIWFTVTRVYRSSNENLNKCCSKLNYHFAIISEFYWWRTHLPTTQNIVHAENFMIDTMNWILHGMLMNDTSIWLQLRYRMHELCNNFSFQLIVIFEFFDFFLQH